MALFWTQSYRATKRLLQDTSAFADEVVTSLPVGLLATDRTGRIAFVNAAAEQITGLEAEKIRGHRPADVLPGVLSDLVTAADRGETVLERETECHFSDGRRVPLSVSASRIVSEAGHFVGHILILRDLREVKRLQDEIRQKEKLAALGSLSAGVAHEIRNPLSSIKGLASYFGDKFEPGSSDREAAEVMVREVERLNRVVSELLDFARPSELSRRQTDIVDVLNHSVRLVQQDAGLHHIEIRLSTADDLPPLFLDPDRFSQCLLNLYLNAIEAMTNGGVLTVEAAIAPGGGLRITVTDTGPGIPEKYRSKIFDPYFTTKTTGTGLGLAIVYKIIEAHGGSISIESAPGGGTRFTVFLPPAAAEEEKRPA
jgi:two-component system sensor histidine kinase HydH